MKYLLILLFLVPTATHAASTFKELVGSVLEFNQLLVLLIFALAFLFISWKVIELWILKSGDPAAIEKGKKVILVGVLVLVVMSGIWGIIELLQSSF